VSIVLGDISESRANLSSGTPTNDYLNSTCSVPVNQYFWLNSLHPTYPMHDVLAQQVAGQLTAGPNVC
jgi:phospholipase/lecithinase/hemolysin